jgi:hypothetical protein
MKNLMGKYVWKSGKMVCDSNNDDNVHLLLV